MGSFAHLAGAVAQVAPFSRRMRLSAVPRRAVRYSGLRSPGTLPQCALM